MPSTTSTSLSSKVRLLFRTPMIPPDPSKGVVEVQLEDLSNSPKRTHSRPSSMESVESFSSDSSSTSPSSEFSIPSFMPSAVSARRISQERTKPQSSSRGNFFGFDDSS